MPLNRKEGGKRKKKETLPLKRETATEREVRLLIEKVQRGESFGRRSSSTAAEYTAELFSRRSSSSQSLKRQPSGESQISTPASSHNEDRVNTKMMQKMFLPPPVATRIESPAAKLSSIAHEISESAVSTKEANHELRRGKEQTFDDDIPTLNTSSPRSLEAREKALEERRHSLEQEMMLIARQRAALQLQKSERDLRKNAHYDLRQEEMRAQNELEAEISQLRTELEMNEKINAEHRDALKIKMENICREYEDAVEYAAKLRRNFDTKCLELQNQCTNATKQRAFQANLSIRSQLEQEALSLGFRLAPKKNASKISVLRTPTTNSSMQVSPKRVSVSPQTHSASHFSTKDTPK
uniref:Uncharacterized protein n=1 Tax=Aureoumbra lagunensis TaxID=44058 RepID=A0A7S3JQP2_9STRA|mmetsp:Transcript_17178/g.22330  ORF Transcript_17178/g.22330 Transcript_17178/m.22330 type:complete len:354 (+) Transcript_17178:75-1136(+)